MRNWTPLYTGDTLDAAGWSKKEEGALLRGTI
jgi:hypothetical protein